MNTETSEQCKQRKQKEQIENIKRKSVEQNMLEKRNDDEYMEMGIIQN